MECHDHIVSAQICVGTQTSFVLINNTFKLQNYRALVMGDWMNREHWWNNIDRAAPKFSNKNLSLYHSDHNKSQRGAGSHPDLRTEHTLKAVNVHLSVWIITNMHNSKKKIYICFGTTVRYCLYSILWIVVILKSGPESVTKKCIYAIAVPSNLSHTDHFSIQHSVYRLQTRHLWTSLW
jgi:hypothetical protein